MALALDPAVLIADEPTTALDATTQMGVLRLIRDVQRRRGAAPAGDGRAEVAHRVAVMRHGRVVE